MRTDEVRAMLASGATELRLPVDTNIGSGRELVVTRWQHRDRGAMIRFTVVAPGAPTLPVGADPWADDAPEDRPDEEFDLAASHPAVEILGVLLGVLGARARSEASSETAP